MNAILLRIGAWVGAALAAIAGLAALWFRAKGEAREEERSKAHEDEIRHREARDEIDRAVARTDDPAAVLRAEWSRPSDRMRDVAPDPDRPGGRSQS